jgi:hypothetical protein
VVILRIVTISMGLVRRARAKRILAFPSIFATAAQIG